MRPLCTAKFQKPWKISDRADRCRREKQHSGSQEWLASRPWSDYTYRRFSVEELETLSTTGITWLELRTPHYWSPGRKRRAKSKIYFKSETLCHHHKKGQSCGPTDWKLSLIQSQTLDRPFSQSLVRDRGVEYTDRYSQNDWLQPENVRGYLSQHFLTGIATVSFAGTET